MSHLRYLVNSITKLQLNANRAPILKFSTSVSDVDYFKKLQGSSSEVILDKSRSDKISVIAMNRQSNKNALSESFVNDLKAAYTELHNDQESRAVVICSLVKNVFCAGADLKERAKIPNKEVSALVGGLRSSFQQLNDLPMPVIAALDGHALGGGLEMALACDLRYATDNPKMKFGLVESHWALLPGAGGSQRLPRIIGRAKALELMFLAKTISGPEALRYGLVNGVAKQEDCPLPEMSAALTALKAAKEISKNGPIAIRMIKKAVHIGLSMPLMEGLELEGQCYDVVIPTKDRKEGMQAFAEKRAPIYVGE
ncbi:hypothetical protein Ciccas_002886 [Cichlidogyrus casuarinus]|uniref:Uncharacterized protein n=1 Tax=Cichlidogyrus casuarinus TaxID=1844966 RepID=A0ABD2QGY3_9PLAT